MGSFYRSQHELVFVLKNGKASHRNNVQLGQFGRYRTNVWEYPGANSFSRNTEEGNLLALHPTVKPVAMIADAILDCSARGDIILDGFLGSGTTVIAAERTGRVCYGLELDPAYVDTYCPPLASFYRQICRAHSIRAYFQRHRGRGHEWVTTNHCTTRSASGSRRQRHGSKSGPIRQSEGPAEGQTQRRHGDHASARRQGDHQRKRPPPRDYEVRGAALARSWQTRLLVATFGLWEW